jgi:hypothetical protein
VQSSDDKKGNAQSEGMKNDGMILSHDRKKIQKKI